MTADSPDGPVDAAGTTGTGESGEPSNHAETVGTADSQGTAKAAESSTDGSAQTGRPDSLEVPDTVDWRGWLLVTIVVFSFLVVPLFVFYIPEMHWFIGRLGFSQRQAYILFPMLPALLLGITAVWAALRSLSS